MKKRFLTPFEMTSIHSVLVEDDDPAKLCISISLERSETHRFERLECHKLKTDGFRFALPILRSLSEFLQR